MYYSLRKKKTKKVLIKFHNKALLITGGTGSFGNAVLNRFLATDIGEIRIFSRDDYITQKAANSP